ncbi:Hsp70 family protein [Pseudoroseomonas wenyumeiae]|uniref:Hsp70 family protein n=1 Tax=Teichococcus wenyumeiae TaxID=2478470 RepID=A0A3A9JK86_9PROT|nr:Hsp70 family protein [Pseudoroseomonas wenyumeiae]RKK04975.1 Hsp70 family protein [Pseudoroseomonas wenyumeiae]RMI26052.1 Hsp70 family protein [Pseudoroseomonas wenyumeiae]
MQDVIGIDFGTTNSVIALRQPDGQAVGLRYAAGRGVVDTFRSVLCFWAEESGASRGKLQHAAGPDAIEAYLDDPLGARLIMSMKSYLASRSFVETRVFNRPFALEDLISTFLRALVAGAAGMPGGKTRVVAGRPVRFVGDNADDDLAEQRLRAAFGAAGFSDVTMALEPEAAGHRFAATLEGNANVLVGDFGGGTSDFSILRFEPGARRRVTPLGHAGVGIAGDAFDYRIIDNVISPRLGKGDSYRVMGTDLPVPPAFFTSFARWHQLSLMRAPKTLREINEVARMALHPERLHHLIRLVEDEAGYALYQAVSAAKAALSGAEEAVLRFTHRDLAIEAPIRRADFENWITPELSRLSDAIDRALADAKLAPEQVDRVFLTGGTSLVPAVRRLFDQRFGGRVTGGGEFVSVAEGLALIGA